MAAGIFINRPPGGGQRVLNLNTLWNPQTKAAPLDPSLRANSRPPSRRSSSYGGHGALARNLSWACRRDRSVALVRIYLLKFFLPFMVSTARSAAYRTIKNFLSLAQLSEREKITEPARALLRPACLSPERSRGDRCGLYVHLMYKTLRSDCDICMNRRSSRREMSWWVYRMGGF